MYAYCIQCESQRTDVIQSLLVRRGFCDAAYDLRYLQHDRRNGADSDVLTSRFPGYLFVYRAESPLNPDDLRTVLGFIRCLRYADGCYELRGADYDFAAMVLDKQGVIGKTKIYKVGQTVRILDGEFQGVEAEIIKLNKRYHRMVVLLPYSHFKVTVSVEYEMVEEVGEAAVPVAGGAPEEDQEPAVHDEAKSRED